MKATELLSEVAKVIECTANALGKAVWVFVSVFVAIAVVTGHPPLLKAIRDRLVLAGITSLKTPLGDVNPEKIGQLDTASRILGVNAARASELANDVVDEHAKQTLQLMANELQEQQHIQVKALDEASRKLRSSNEISVAKSNDIEGFVYVGRRSEDKWRPLSFSIREAAYPITIGSALVINANALIYDNVDCEADNVSNSSKSVTADYNFFVSADPTGVAVIETPTECSSIGGAKTVWARVRVPSSRIIKVAS